MLTQAQVSNKVQLTPAEVSYINQLIGSNISANRGYYLQVKHIIRRF